MAPLSKPISPNPELEARLRASVEALKEMPPLERAILELRQKRSFVIGNDFSADSEQSARIVDAFPEYIVLAAYEKVAAELIAARERIKKLEINFEAATRALIDLGEQHRRLRAKLDAVRKANEKPFIDLGPGVCRTGERRKGMVTV